MSDKEQKELSELREMRDRLIRVEIVDTEFLDVPIRVLDAVHELDQLCTVARTLAKKYQTHK